MLPADNFHYQLLDSTSLEIVAGHFIVQQLLLNRLILVCPVMLRKSINAALIMTGRFCLWYTATQTDSEAHSKYIIGKKGSQLAVRVGALHFQQVSLARMTKRNKQMWSPHQGVETDAVKVINSTCAYDLV